MKSSTVLGLLLVASVIVNAYLFFKTPGGGSHDFNGYGEPYTIKKEVAEGFVAKYEESLPQGEYITGGYITRDAFDKMLEQTDCNGIYYSFARDKSGTGPKDGSVFLILTSAKVTLDDNGQVKTAAPLGDVYYYSRPWCPPNCILVK